MIRFLCIICFFFANAGLALAAENKLPPELPTPVGTAPLTKPSAPVPAPVEPTFTQTPVLQKTADKVLDVIENPTQIKDAISQAPKVISKQIQRAKESVINTSQDPSVFNGKNFEMLKWQNSLMFPKDQLKRLYNVAKDLTDQSVGSVVVEVKIPRSAPAFYLNSVLYNTPSNWTIWLNSRRIRTGSKFPELEISKVSQDMVEFIWQTDQLDFLSPDWEKNVPPVKITPDDPVLRFAYESKDKLIAVDASRRFVRFTIGPHQTFVSRQMKIVEGFVKSTKFETVQKVVTAAPEGSSPQIPGATPLPAAATPAATTKQ